MTQHWIIGQELGPGMLPLVEDVYRIDEKTPRRWYVLQVIPKTEQRVAAEIGDLGAPTYVPVRRFWSKPDQLTNKVRRLEEPLLVGYLIVELPVEGAFKHVRECDGAIRFIEIEGSPAPIADRWVEWMLDREAKGAFDSTRKRRGVRADGPFPSWIFKGAEVRIDDGPFMSFNATVIEATRIGRLVAEVQLFGRPTRIDLELAQVKEL